MTRVITGVIQGHNLARSLQSANFVVLQQRGDSILIVCLSFRLEVKCVFAQVRWFEMSFLCFAVICNFLTAIN